MQPKPIAAVHFSIVQEQAHYYESTTSRLTFWFVLYYKSYSFKEQYILVVASDFLLLSFFFFLFLRTIYESLQVIFAAGTDTSSTPVKWAMSEMMRQPKVLEKAQAEIRQAFRGKKKNP